MNTGAALLLRAPTANTLRLSGTVAPKADLWEDEEGFSATTVTNFLDGAGGADIAITINSPGGSVFEGNAIYGMLKGYAGKVTITVEGLAASAASVIVCAGDVVVMAPGAMLMIHDPTNVTWGDEEAHRRTANQLAKVKANVVRIYADKTGLSETDLAAMMAAETWMDAEEAVQFGFADMMDDGATMTAAPPFPYSQHYRNTPTALMALDTARKETSMANAAATQKPKASQMSAAEMTVFNKWRDNPYATKDFSTDEIQMMAKQSKGDDQAFRDIMLQVHAERQGPPIISHPNMHGSSIDISEQLAEGMAAPHMSNGRALRSSNPYYGATMVEGFRHFAQSMGINTGSMSDKQVLAAMISPGRGPSSSRSMMAHAASDFPYITADSMTKIAMDRFTQSQPVLKVLSRGQNNTNFHPTSAIRMGEMGAMEAVAENGEIKSVTFGEEAQSLRVKSYGLMASISYEALVNDDLGLFSQIPFLAADAGLTTEKGLFYAALVGDGGLGAVMKDEKTVFHADRGNLAATGAALTIDTLSAARKAMRLQKGVDKKVPAGAAPKYLAVGPELETLAEKLIAEIAATSADSVNPFGGKLELLVIDEYEGGGWWLFADPATRPFFAHAYLNGNEGPIIEAREGWEVRGMQFRGTLDFGCAPMDWRAAYHNPGA